MEQVILGFSGAVFALLLAVLWRHRIGPPIVFGMCALIGAVGVGWSFGRDGTSILLIVVSLAVMIGGAQALALWIGIEMRRVNRQGGADAESGERKSQDHATDSLDEP